jgi:hypothetical protein
MPKIESGTYNGIASRVQQAFSFDRVQSQLVVTNNSTTEKIVVSVSDEERTLGPSESYTFNEEFKVFNIKTKSKTGTASFTAVSSGSLSEARAAIANLGGGTGGVDEAAVTLIAQGVVAPLVNPVTANLTITAPEGSVVEVGASATPSMDWSIGNVANAQSAKIIDGNNATVKTLTLASSGTFTEAEAITKNQVDSISYRLSVQDKAGRTINSPTRTINWRLGVYYGSSTSATLDEAGIKELTKSLKASMSGSYAFTGTGYKYVIIPATFAVVSLFDVATGFALPLTQIALVDVTNNGVTTSYKVLRSSEQIGDVTVESK